MTASEPPSPPTSIRRPSDRLALVRWVRDTNGLQEPDWLEWKRGYDLTGKRSRATTAKHLIGFANRDPAAAARHLDGFGCLLLGVEPGTCPGVPEHDSADLETWLRPFLGEKVVFDIHYVTLDGARVLLLAVEPPRYGDDIHSLRKGSEDTDTGKTMREGTIFVRRTGKTEPANTADIDRLTARARQVGLGLRLGLKVMAPVKTLAPALLRGELRDRYLDERRRKLLDSLPAPSPSAFSISIPPSLIGENRTEEQFVAAVKRFVADATARWETFVAVRELERSPTALQLELINETDDNFEDVVLEVTLPLSPGSVHLGVADARETLQPPEEPPKWGSGMLGALQTISAASKESFQAELVDQGAQTLIRFSRCEHDRIPATRCLR